MIENNFDCIIPLGQSCNITVLLQNAKIKKYTTLFEWFCSPNLKDITSALIKIGNNTDNNIIKQYGPDNICIDNEIYSSHYTYEQFKPIYIRRKTRLINTIKQSSKLLFCRFEGTDNVYTKEDIDNFIKSILIINPTPQDIKLLLITPNQSELEHPSLIKIFYNKQNSDLYCRGKEINDFFVNTLKEIGFNLNNTSDICFTDNSDL